MYKILTDTHTHTIFSGHAYSTIEENVRAAKEQGMEALGTTDHFSALFVPDTRNQFYGHLTNFKAIPKEWYGVRLFFGAEADIVDLDGNLFGHDLNLPYPWGGEQPSYLDMLTRQADYLIASIHNPTFLADKSLVQTTEMYCRALDNPKVLIIGHIGRAGVPFEMDEVLKAAKAKNKMIEINEASHEYPEHITNLCRQVAIRCAELGVKISVGSDAHSSWYVGKFDKVKAMLEEIHFPEELIGTRNRASLEAMIDSL